ncbi:hypothetical protein Smp_149690 [Schistosoma mansoni]|uniref:hypothetical protein n=1 Tax=Schistosoma mansoni TaxID=6183 RepID=UPI00022C8673|nr:hypothetical protein Smp_149690 [Schistosoma mansoni]|eukprot:XP_018644246.1 hypothetical protein Smp_149690 [Schistosoma mansoni]
MTNVYSLFRLMPKHAAFSVVILLVGRKVLLRDMNNIILKEKGLHNKKKREKKTVTVYKWRIELKEQTNLVIEKKYNVHK